MSSTGLVILGLANIPIYFFIGKVIFKTWEGFWDAVLFWLTPDLLSAFNGRYWDDWVGELKLGAWGFCCFICVYGEYLLVEKFIG